MLQEFKDRLTLISQIEGSVCDWKLYDTELPSALYPKLNINIKMVQNMLAYFALLTEKVCIYKSFTYNWENDLSGHRVFSVPQGAFNDKSKLQCAFGDYPCIR